MILERLRRRKRSRQHPTPKQAFEALEQACCMYAPVSSCSTRPRSVGLRDDLDSNVVLCCGAHVGRLRKLDARRLDELERTLVPAFAPRAFTFVEE